MLPLWGAEGDSSVLNARLRPELRYKGMTSEVGFAPLSYITPLYAKTALTMASIASASSKEQIDMAYVCLNRATLEVQQHTCGSCDKGSCSQCARAVLLPLYFPVLR